MLKRFILASLLGSLTALSSHAAEETKAPAAPAPSAAARPNEASGKISPAEIRPAETPKRNRKWSNATLDLTHCLERGSNMEVIRCAH